MALFRNFAIEVLLLVSSKHVGVEWEVELSVISVLLSYPSPSRPTLEYLTAQAKCFTEI